LSWSSGPAQRFHVWNQRRFGPIFWKLAGREQAMKKNPSLREAAIQEIQLELIRRTQFNAFDGERVYRSLVEHRNLWEAVLFDRLSSRLPGILPPGSLIKLRDLSSNLWNADTLYILTPNAAAARMLAGLHKSAEWCGEVYVFEDAEQVDNALGGDDRGKAIVRVWWD
jgi:hypothetical protein